MIINPKVDSRSAGVIEGTNHTSKDKKANVAFTQSPFSKLLAKAEHKHSAKEKPEHLSLHPNPPQPHAEEKPIPGDADLNGRVDRADFKIWADNKFQKGTDWSTGDFNGDGMTDGQDFMLWNKNKFTGTYNDRLPGDADLNGRVDKDDFEIWKKHSFQSGTDWSTGDFNGDGVTDGQDFNIWNSHKFTGTYNDRKAGDANLDGKVNAIDFRIWNQNKFTEGTDWSTGDFNGDGVTDGLDFKIWNENKELPTNPIRKHLRTRFSDENLYDKLLSRSESA